MAKRKPKGPKPHSFRNKLLLNQWFLSLLGIDPLTENNVRPFHLLAEPIKAPKLESLALTTCTISIITLAIALFSVIVNRTCNCRAFKWIGRFGNGQGDILQQVNNSSDRQELRMKTERFREGVKIFYRGKSNAATGR